MIRMVTMTGLILGLAACASSGPQSGGLPASNNAEDSIFVAGAGTNEAPATAPAAEGGAIDYVEAPTVEKSAAIEPEQRDDVICRRERETGSHRVKNVCRSRGETKATRDETHEALREAARRTGSSANSN